MKSFSDFLKLDETVYQPKSEDEKRFKDKHVVNTKDHPVAKDDQFVAKKTKAKRAADLAPGEDEDIYEAVETVTCEDCGEEYEEGEEHECNDDDEDDDDDVDEEAQPKWKVAIGKKTYTVVGRNTAEANRKAKLLAKKDNNAGVGGKIERINEEEMSSAQTKKREEIVKSMKDKMSEFKKRYGDRAKDVMYATATKMAMKEEVNLDEESVKVEIPKSRYLTIIKAHGPKKDLLVKTPKGEMKYRAREDYKHDKSTDTTTVQTYSHPDHNIATVEKAHHKPSDSVTYYMYKKQKNESVGLDEISRDLATRAAHGFADKGDRALKNKDSSEYKRSERGRKMAVDKATGYAKVNAVPRRVKLPEEVSLIESVKAGSLKLKDGTNVKLSKEEASAVSQLFSELNSANKKKMEQRMMESKKGFDEIVNFAKEAM